MKNINLRFSYDSGVPDAIERAAKDMGVPITIFVKTTIVDRLDAMGYIDKKDVLIKGPGRTGNTPYK